MNEKYVQVPVSLIERIRRDYSVKNLGPNIVDALDALFSQPTPTAEHKPDWSDWSIDHPEEGPNCSCGFNGSFEECAEWRAAEAAEPPRIEDLALGTTFTARILGQIEDDLWFRTALGITSATGVRAELWHIDPSTIRDVTSPKDAA